MLSAHDDHHCQHRSDDFPAIAEILCPHRPKIVVELGTDEGGFASFLAALARGWGGEVYTFDILAKYKPHLLSIPNLHFEQADVLIAVHPRVKDLITRPEVLLYCDNGNKPKEVELYAPFLRVGSILGVHDYNSEIMGSWVEPHVAALGYVPEGHAKMEALRNEWYPEPMSRFWTRKALPGAVPHV